MRFVVFTKTEYWQLKFGLKLTSKLPIIFKANEMIIVGVFTYFYLLSSTCATLYYLL